MSRAWISHVPRQLQARLRVKVTSRIWMSHVPCMNKSRPTSIRGNALCARQVSDMNKSRPTSTAIAGNRACVIPRILSCIWMSHVPHAVSCIWMSQHPTYYVPYINESRPMYYAIWMSLVPHPVQVNETYICESCPTYEWVLSHITAGKCVSAHMGWQWSEISIVCLGSFVKKPENDTTFWWKNRAKIRIFFPKK